MTDRRTFIAGLALAPVVISAPAVAAPQETVIARYWRAHHGLSGGTVSEEDYLDALGAVRGWKPQTAQEFMQKFLVLCDDGDTPHKHVLVALWRDAGRIEGV